MRTPYLFKTDCGCIVRGDALIYCQTHGAAPDLLEACKKLLVALENMPGKFNYPAILEDNLRVAISKAERGEGK